MLACSTIQNLKPFAVGFAAVFFAVMQPLVVQATASGDLLTYDDPYYGVTVQYPSSWYMEIEPPDYHANPWHLPVIPVKELQPSPIDLLIEGKKRLIIDLEPGDETSSRARVFIEKTGGLTLDRYVESSIVRLEENNPGIRIETGSATLSGQPAARLVATSKGGDFQTVQVLATFNNNLAYTVQYSSAREDNGVHLQAMQQIAGSVTISPPQSWSNVVAASIGTAAAAVAGAAAIKLRNRGSLTSRLLRETRRLFPAALGIEVLCVASAEAGGIMGFYFFGFNPLGVAMSYALAYGLAGFTTFASILGRATAGHDHAEMACSCSSLLGHGAAGGFAKNIKITFRSFASGIKRLPTLYREANAAGIIRTSVVILVTAESACILVAATVDLLLYQYSVMLSIPLALMAGTLTVAALAAYKSAKAMPVTE